MSFLKSLMDPFRYTIWIVCFLLFRTVPVYGQSSEPGELTVRFNEEFIIGNDGEEPESLLGNPSSIRTDDDGNIYVTETRSPIIKMFGAGGEFIKTVGRAGQGPGEFSGDNPVMGVNNQNQLEVFNGARISRFSTSGELVSTIVPEIDTMVWPGGSDNLYQLADGRYIIVRKLADLEGAEHPQMEDYYSSVLHQFDSTFTEHSVSFGDLYSMVETDNQYVRSHLRFGSQAGRILQTENGDIWYVPSIYDGKLFRFVESEDGWNMSEIIQGFIYPDEAVITGDRVASMEGAQVIVTYGSGSAVSSYGRVNSESLGLFQLNDGRLVHFSVQYIDESEEMLMEVFDNNGVLTGIGQPDVFSGITLTEIAGGTINPLWKDDNDKFYIYTYSVGEVPVIRVGRFAGI